MNKIIQINLGGYPFTIDEDAYEHLSNYLNVIHRHFRQSQGYDDITSDIENRVAEILMEKLEGRPIINLKDIQEVIVIMGTPEEFGADTTEESTAQRRYQTGKRLFRDPEDQVIGGISSGIAAYFGFKNPLWIRLIFIALTVTGGLGIAVYIILWLALPKAESASDKLAMRGEPINISTIGKVVETELDHLSDAMTELEEELTSKKKNYSKANNHSKRNFASIGKFFKKSINIMFKILKPLLILIATALIIAFSLVWIGTLIGVFYASPLIDAILPENLINAIIPKTNLLFVVGIPLLTLILLVSKLMFRTRIPAFWQVALALLWVGNMGSLAYFVVHTAQEFAMGGEVTRLEEIPKSKILQIHLEEDPFENGFYLLGPDLMLDGSDLISKQISLDFKQSSDDKIRVKKEFYSRGASRREAKSLAEEMEDLLLFEDGQLKFKPYFKMPSNGKYRDQHVHYTLLLPVGQHLTYTGNRMRTRSYRHGFHLPVNKPNRLLKMELTGINCINCDNDKAEEFHYSNRDFRTLEIDGNLHLTLQKADQFKVSLITDPVTSKTIAVEQKEDQLNIRRSTNGKEHVRLIVYMPSLEFLALRNLEHASIKGFDTNRFRLRADHAKKILADVNSDTMTMDLTEVAELRLEGDLSRLQASLSNNSKVSAYNLKVKDVEMELTDNSHAEFGRIESLKKQADDASSFRSWHVEKVIE